MKKIIWIFVLIACGFTTGFTCSKNAPQQAENAPADTLPIETPPESAPPEVTK